MKIKNWLSLPLCLALLLAITGVAFAAGFTDLQGHWAEKQINQWAAKGLAGGYEDGTFRPDNGVTRAEFVALVNRAFAIPASGAVDSFTDVSNDQWFYGEVAKAKAAGYIGGYEDGTFRPNQTISRQEVASILVRLLKLQPTSEGTGLFADTQQIQEWARPAIGAVVKSGLMKGYPDNTFQPVKSITRAEAVVVLDRALAGQVVSGTGMEGTVTFNGKAVPNAVVRVFEADGIVVLKETKTAANGTFKLELKAGKYDVTAVTDNQVAYKSDVQVHVDQPAVVSLAMEEAAVISGTLVDKNDKVVKKATLAFTTNPTFVTTTDNDGKFTLPVLANKTYTVRAYNPEKPNDAPDVVSSSLQVGAAGKHTIDTLKARFALSSTGGGGGGSGGNGGSGGDTPGPVVIEKEVTLGVPVSLGKIDKETKVKVTTTLNGQPVVFEIDIPAIGTTCTLEVKAIPSDVPVPDSGPFLALDIALVGAEGQEVTIALPLPDGLDSSNAAAYHYNSSTGMWEFRASTIVNGKVVFKTTLSPVAVGPKVGVPRGLKATKVTTDTIILAWDAVAEAAKYIIYRDGTKIGEAVTTSYSDTNLAAGYKYTYTVEAVNGKNFTSDKSAAKTITTAAVTVPGNNLLEILDAVEEALNKISEEDWNKLKEKRDHLLGYTDDEILDALKSTGLAKAFENVINSSISEQQARTTIAIIRSVAYLGRDTVYENRATIINKVKELKETYKTEIAKFTKRGVNQQVVYNYLVDLYDAILLEKYPIRSSSYEADLYDAALNVLRSGNHPKLADVTKEAFDRIKADYSKINENDSEFKKALKELIAQQEFATLNGSQVRLMKEYLISEVQGGDNTKYQTVVSFMELIIETSKVIIIPNS